MLVAFAKVLVGFGCFRRFAEPRGGGSPPQPLPRVSKPSCTKRRQRSFDQRQFADPRGGGGGLGDRLPSRQQTGPPKII